MDLDELVRLGYVYRVSLTADLIKIYELAEDPEEVRRYPWLYVIRDGNTYRELGE